ncbi:MAG TPA: prolipoprotein diacylglyceryl transferase [Nitrolancea sp.]|nr:prolipoprotein diacylglyceryl transferase [Nitrolancea sp.]
MLHFTIGMDPNLFEIGGLVIAWHAIAILVGIVMAVSLTRREFIRKQLPLKNWDMIVYITVAGGIIGARLFFLLDRPIYHLQHPLGIFALQEGGLAVYGAVIGGFITVILLCLYYHLPALKVIDAVAPGLILAQAFGRIGCLINGDAWGGPTSSFFSVTYTNSKALLPPELLGVRTYPYPIYDGIINLIILAIVWRLRKRGVPDGMVFAVFAALYAATRFTISFMRQERVWFLGLQQAQVIAIVMLVCSVAGMALLWQRRGLAPTEA